jgi:hypothetical protein
MGFTGPPPSAAWAHHDARQGFEVAYFERNAAGHRVTGCTTAVEDGQAWVVDYRIHLAPDWTTRRARVTGRSSAGVRSVLLEADGEGGWAVDGKPAAGLRGCLDVDLEASAMTNAFPVHRLGLRVGDQGSAPAAYVRAVDLSVERLEQTYVRGRDEADRQRYDYTAPAFDFACELTYDGAGLVLTYPGLAVRVA